MQFIACLFNVSKFYYIEHGAFVLSHKNVIHFLARWEYKKIIIYCTDTNIVRIESDEKS